MSTEEFFRKSTFCTLTEAKPGFDGHWVMPEIFLLNGSFTILEMTAFLLNTFFNSMHWCKSATLKIANLAMLNHYMVLLNQCTMAEMTSIKGSFLALGARSQSWKLNNLWFFFLVKLTGVTSCLLQFDRIFFCSDNFSNIKCTVSNIKIKIAEKRGQLALIS